MGLERRVRAFSAVVTLLLSLGFLPFAAASAAAEKRVALVIGNSTYKHVARLANPANDARLMAESLRAVGFTLVGNGPQLDLDEADLRRAVRDFGVALQGADVGLFYYAGHAVEVRKSNYLVPVGANPTREADVDFQMLDANLVLRQMEGAGTKLNIVMLDACRNNPFAGRGLRSTGSGLAQMQAPEGTLISFATQPGNVALDGTGSNSPYTTALAQVIRKPGIDIFRTFNEVGLAVSRATGGAQQPWVSLSPIKGDFYFAGRAVGVEPAAGAATPPAAPPPDPAAQAWVATQNTTSIAVLEDFIRQFGSTVYGSLARARLEELKKSQVAAAAPPGGQTVPPSPVTPAVGVFPTSRAAKPLTQAEERALKPKDSFKECDTCPEMVVVPAGSFTMGSPAGEQGRDSDEGPQRRVTFARPFAVGKFEVTFAEWDACVADGGCNGYRPSDQGWGRGGRPVINVNWNDAKAYVAWLSKTTGKGYRLLSEAEWEYAARAGTATRSSCGDGDGCLDGVAWYGSNSGGRTQPVGGKAANAFGLYDMHGNVWEWTEDCWNDSYRGAPTDGSAWMAGSCGRRVLRGGSWSNYPGSLRSAFRSWNASVIRDLFGFRVARTLLTP